MLFRVANALKVDRSEVNSILSIRINSHRRKDEKQEKTKIFNSVFMKSTYLKFFGLEIDANFVDVKKAYRNLAKKFHPDLFSNMGEADKIMAHERFTEINNAYEFLEKILA